MSVIRHGNERFECPNGHQVAGDYIVECDECDATVAYVPLAVEIRLLEQLRGAVEGIRRELQAIRAVLPEDPNRRLGVFDHLAEIDRLIGGQ